MTVSTITVEHSYRPGAAMLAEAIPFQFLDAADLIGEELFDDDSPAVPLARGTDFTITGDGPSKTGRVTALRAFAADRRLRVRRKTAMVQQAEIRPGQPLPAKDVERQLDRTAMRTQEQAADQLDLNARALTVLPGQSLAPIDKRLFAGRFFAGGVSGDPIPASGTGNDPALRFDLAGGNGGSLIGYLVGYVGAKVRSLRSRLLSSVDVMDFGAVGDGVTDDTAAFDAAIATGRGVYVPRPPVGYSVANIRVISSAHVFGEKAGMADAPLLIVRDSGASAFRKAAGDNVFQVKLERLACTAAPGVTDASFYGQTDQEYYSAYFTFREIETHRSLRASYAGLFIFALWDRVRDGYLGSPSDNQHSGIIALASAYGQTNRQNINRVKDSMFFNSYGGQGAIVGSYGTLWTLYNVDFEALQTRAFIGYNVTQVRFTDCWFENVSAASIIDLRTYTGTQAGSSGYLDHCTVVMTGNAPVAVTLDNASLAVRRTTFDLVPAGSRLTDNGGRVTINEDNSVGGDGAAAFMNGAHHDVYSDGRRMLNGATYNSIGAMTIQNQGGIVASEGFMSRDNIAVGSAAFVTIATSATGLGGLCAISGFDPMGGSQFRMNVEWQGLVSQVNGDPMNSTGKVMSFQVVDNSLQMKVSAGSVVVFTTLQN